MLTAQLILAELPISIDHPPATQFNLTQVCFKPDLNYVVIY